MSPKAKTLNNRLLRWQKAILFMLWSLLSILAARDLFIPGWGSGHLLGRLSEKWVLLLVICYLLMAGLVLFIYRCVFFSGHEGFLSRAAEIREKLGIWRWPIILITSVFPAWFVFYSPWGDLFPGIFLRLLIFVIAVSVSGFLLTIEKKTYITWTSFLWSGLIVGVFLVFAESLILVSDYPFALHWSEGNRLWDYSIAFGDSRYNYSASEPIFAWIDPGRQTLWGLPFLLPNVPIWAIRLWGAILVTLPYVLLGLLAFRRSVDNKALWIAAGLWTLVFLNQGPIYTPLVLAAILVTLARKQPLWLAVPLIFIAGHYAGVSRFTWRFAPGIWAVILTLGDAILARGNILLRDWLKAAALGLAGIWSKGLPIILGVVAGLIPSDSVIPNEVPSQNIETLSGLQNVTTQQPFLIERLLPNSIYPPGILIGIALATLPLIALLIQLNRHRYWKLIFWQQFAIILGLGVLFVVGVIASAKVGGGADLHNMDMFFVGLILLAGLAWEAGFAKRFSQMIQKSKLSSFLIGAMVFIPVFQPLFNGKPLQLPSQERTNFVLSRIQDTVACARQYGEVLFMDQRQLITFGHMGDLPMVVDYEKKYVMDKALMEDEDYFEKFRNDLSSGRFSLIVSEREAILYKQPDIESIGDSLIEENNAWVKWVTIPLLHEYESIADFKDAAIEMFMPIGRTYECR
jgi:hypothetical protein